KLMHKKIKICHVASGDLWAGAEVQIFEQLRNLSVDDRFEVSAILLNEGQLCEDIRSLGIDVFVLDESKTKFLALQKQFRKLVNEIKPDILHSHRYKENLLCGFLGPGSHPAKLITTVHGLVEPFSAFLSIKAKIYNS